MPYVWPRKDRRLQLYVLLNFALLAIGRVVNVYLPLYNKYIGKFVGNRAYLNVLIQLVDSLSSTGLHHAKFCWDLILIYSLLRFVQGSGGKL